MFTAGHFWTSANREDASPTMVLREAVIDPLVAASVGAQEYGRAHLLPPGFDAWFARCVVRTPQDRFEDAGVARQAFAEMMDGSSAAHPGSSTLAEAPTLFAVGGTPPGATTPAAPLAPT